ncbi:hypothetical protein B6V72_17255 [Thioclava sp. F34-6]|uniref:hypothetical protein n=1 Tax=Thioclava sp. F34-6 TaxID=1973003 RepID=UPI000B5451BF|nr:hypothetical protein [Thioclava sp. F34-6]OWY10362.1 hypothetical protein B6V72_17255 [Thioclava sp. F34-6]
MGLTVHAFSNLRRVDAFAYGDKAIEMGTGKSIDAFVPAIDPDFAHYALDLEHDKFYKFEKHYHFEAGSYCYNNDFLRELAKLAIAKKEFEYGSNDEKSDASSQYFESCHIRPLWPFSQLIELAACSGTLGVSTAKKLARDFETHAKLAQEHPNETFRRDYSNWQTALEVASDRGGIAFRLIIAKQVPGKRTPFPR